MPAAGFYLPFERGRLCWGLRSRIHCTGLNQDKCLGVIVCKMKEASDIMKLFHFESEVARGRSGYVIAIDYILLFV